MTARKRVASSGRTVLRSRSRAAQQYVVACTEEVGPQVMLRRRGEHRAADGPLPVPPPGCVSRPVQPERVSATNACHVMGPTMPSTAKPGTS